MYMYVACILCVQISFFTTGRGEEEGDRCMGDERDTDIQEMMAKVRELTIRINEIDALVRGITGEMLDLKAIVMKLLKDQQNTPIIRHISEKPEPVQPPRTPDIIEKGKEKASQSSQTPPLPVVRDKVYLKMQPDGTLKPEEDHREEIIIASAYDARKNAKKKNGAQQGDDSNLIIADDE